MAVALSLRYFQGNQGAEGAAEAFLDSCYVRVDLAKVERFTADLAMSKVASQRQETRSLSSVGRDLSNVSYCLLGRRGVKQSGILMSCEMTITPRGGELFRRTVFLNLRETREGWRVSIFREENPESLICSRSRKMWAIQSGALPRRSSALMGGGRFPG